MIKEWSEFILMDAQFEMAMFLIVFVGLELLEIHFTPQDECQAVDFLKVEAIKEVFC